MAYPTNSHTATSLASFIPEVWGEKINEFFQSKLVAAPFFTDRSDEVRDGGDTLYTPSISELSANAKVNSAAVTLNRPTDPKVTLTINDWQESSFAIEDAQAAQVKRSYTVQERYARSAAYAIAKKLDEAIIALFTGFSVSVGASTTALADSVVRAAISALESADVPTDECAFFMHPSVFWTQVQAIDKFSLATNSPVNDPTAKRPAGFLYGFRVYTTTLMPYVSGTTGRIATLAHPDAIHWATSPLEMGGSSTAMIGSKGIRVQSNYVPQYLSTVTTADILFGVVENRDEAGVRILTLA